MKTPPTSRGSYGSPGFAPTASTVVFGSVATAPRLVPGLGVDEGARRRVDLVVAEHERRPPARDEVELLVAVLLVVLLDHALVALSAVYAFVPKAVMPSRCRTGRQSRPSSSTG